MKWYFCRLLICIVGLASTFAKRDGNIKGRGSNTVIQPIPDTVVYQDGYVFEEPVGEACVKWGNYLPEDEKESIEQFRARWAVPNPKKIHENCDSSITPGECQHPLECISNKCQCQHSWNDTRQTCKISPAWVPNLGPGCFDSEDCVDLADCYLQHPCHCTANDCKVVRGICFCHYPNPPNGFRDGLCERVEPKKHKDKRA